MITLTIDGREVHAEPGMTIYQAAKAAGIDIPIFCYHPRMKPVAACRMCLVKVEKMPKLQTACSTPVAEGMVVFTETEEVKKAQAGVLEFLLAQHPLDCPICDKGGECPLQDTSFRYGPPHTRFQERKRHLDKARSLGPLVVLDQERCIQCQRCTRFMDEIVGDPVLTLQFRGADTVVDVAEGRIFDSIYSGNTIEMCPVGALTSRPYRFRARPWDIVPMASVCPHCPVGCNITVTVRGTDVLRFLSRENEEVDQGWLCDRGRFGFGYLDDERRLFTPLVRRDGELVPASWDEALEAVRRALSGKRAAALGGARLTTEGVFAWKAFLDSIGAEYDWRIRGEATALPPGPQTFIRDVSDADGILFVGSAPLEEVPVLHLRVRHRVVNERGAKAFLIGPRRTGTDLPVAAVLVPPEEVAPTLAKAAAGELEDRLPGLLEVERLVVLWDGKSGEVYRALETLIARRGQRFTGVLVTGGLTNARGADLLGFAPRTRERRTAREILEGVAKGEIEVLFLLHQDLLRDFPDGRLVRQALLRRPFTVVLDHFEEAVRDFADVVLPLAAFTEAPGSFVNLEGRRQPYLPVVAQPEGVLADYEVALRLNEKSLDFRHLERELLREHPELRVLERRPAAVPPRFEAEEGGEVVVVETLYHRGITPERHLPHLAEKAWTLTVHPSTAEARGWQEGDEVVVATEAGEARLRLTISPGVVPGRYFLDDGVPGARLCADPSVFKVLARRDA